jgi:hypothetical protein
MRQSRWLSLAVALIVAAPLPAIAPYFSIGTCSYFDPRLMAGPIVGLLMAGAAVVIGVTALRRKASASAISVVVVGTLECAALVLPTLQIALCIPAPA